MKIKIKPAGFDLPYDSCPPGLFLFEGMIGLKSEYNSGQGYCDTGETFDGGGKIVTPLEYVFVFEYGDGDLKRSTRGINERVRSGE